MKNNQDNQENRESRRFTIRLKVSEYEMLYGLATKKGFTVSEIVRELIYKQIGIDGANDGLDVIRQMIHEEIKIQLKAQIERLIKIIIKIGIIDVSSYFYIKAVLKLTDPVLEEELRDNARKEAAAYLGMRNSRAAEEVYREFSENYSVDYNDDYDGESETD